jgi:fluoroacetyl-CoA thioesterase
VRIEIGMTAKATTTVTREDTARAMGSGDVEVLATPRLVALCEEACCSAVAGALRSDQTTVGVRVQLDHLAPLRVGSAVTAEATLERIEGRRLAFTVSASDDAGLVAAGRMTRVVIDTQAFLAKAR